MNKDKYITIFYAEIAPLKDRELFDCYLKTIDRERQQKISRLVREKDKMRSLGAGVLLVHALKTKGIICGEDTVFEKGKKGKPFLQDCPVFFNISHSGEYVMCGISSDEIGCDTEKIRKANLNLAKRFFSEKEYGKIQSEESNEKRDELFTEYWTVRESASKLTGEGLGAISSFDFEKDKQINKKTYYEGENVFSVCSRLKCFPEEMIRVIL